MHRALGAVRALSDNRADGERRTGLSKIFCPEDTPRNDLCRHRICDISDPQNINNKSRCAPRTCLGVIQLR